MFTIQVCTESNPMNRQTLDVIELHLDEEQENKYPDQKKDENLLHQYFSKYLSSSYFFNLFNQKPDDKIKLFSVPPILHIRLDRIYYDTKLNKKVSSYIHQTMS